MIVEVIKMSRMRVNRKQKTVDVVEKTRQMGVGAENTSYFICRQESPRAASHDPFKVILIKLVGSLTRRERHQPRLSNIAASLFDRFHTLHYYFYSKSVIA